jgi:hypothetical protein
MRDVLFQCLQKILHPLALLIGCAADRTTTAHYRKLCLPGKTDDV